MKEKIKSLLANLLVIYELKIVPFFKENWFPIINTIILLGALRVTTDANLFGMATILGLWIVILGGSLIVKLFKNGKL